MNDRAAAQYAVDGTNVAADQLAAHAFAAAGPVPAIEDYARALKLGGTADDLIDAMLRQDRYCWREDLTAGAINQWLRQ